MPNLQFKYITIRSNPANVGTGTYDDPWDGSVIPNGGGSYTFRLADILEDPSKIVDGDTVILDAKEFETRRIDLSKNQQSTPRRLTIRGQGMDFTTIKLSNKVAIPPTTTATSVMGAFAYETTIEDIHFNCNWTQLQSITQNPNLAVNAVGLYGGKNTMRRIRASDSRGVTAGEENFTLVLSANPGIPPYGGPSLYNTFDSCEVEGTHGDYVNAICLHPAYAGSNPRDPGGGIIINCLVKGVSWSAYSSGHNTLVCNNKAVDCGRFWYWDTHPIINMVFECNMAIGCTIGAFHAYPDSQFGAPPDNFGKNLVIQNNVITLASSCNNPAILLDWGINQPAGNYAAVRVTDNSIFYEGTPTSGQKWFAGRPDQFKDVVLSNNRANRAMQRPLHGTYASTWVICNNVEDSTLTALIKNDLGAPVYLTVENIYPDHSGVAGLSADFAGLRRGTLHWTVVPGGDTTWGLQNRQGGTLTNALSGDQNGAIYLSDLRVQRPTDPIMRLWATSQPAGVSNQRKADIRYFSGDSGTGNQGHLQFRFGNDNDSAATTWMEVVRSGLNPVRISALAPLAVGAGGTPITKVVSVTATPNLPNLPGNSEGTITVTVPGVVNANIPTVSVTFNSGLLPNLMCKSAWVSADNQVTLEFRNLSSSAISPGTKNLRITVTMF